MYGVDQALGLELGRGLKYSIRVRAKARASAGAPAMLFFVRKIRPSATRQ